MDSHHKKATNPCRTASKHPWLTTQPRKLHSQQPIPCFSLDISGAGKLTSTTLRGQLYPLYQHYELNIHTHLHSADHIPTIWLIFATTPNRPSPFKRQPPVSPVFLSPLISNFDNSSLMTLPTERSTQPSALPPTFTPHFHLILNHRPPKRHPRPPAPTPASHTAAHPTVLLSLLILLETFTSTQSPLPLPPHVNTTLITSSPLPSLTIGHHPSTS